MQKMKKAWFPWHLPLIFLPVLDQLQNGLHQSRIIQLLQEVAGVQSKKINKKIYTQLTWLHWRGILRWNHSYFSQHLWLDLISLSVVCSAQLMSNPFWSIGEHCWKHYFHWFYIKSQKEIINNSSLCFFIWCDSDSALTLCGGALSFWWETPTPLFKLRESLQRRPSWPRQESDMKIYSWAKTGMISL